jgi:hypothetical protein
MRPSADDWSVECKPFGQYGYSFYHENSREIPFYWEYGGGDTVVIVRIEKRADFDSGYPWAVARKREILGRVAQELIRQQAPHCIAEIDHKNLCIYARAKHQTHSSGVLSL